MVTVTHHASLRRIACLALLFQGVAAVCFHGLTLCIGADGHTALAWMAEDDCCPRPESTKATMDVGCECTDAPLLQPMADKRVGVDELAVSSAASVATGVFAFASLTLAPPAVYGLPPPSNPLSRQSVVLQA